MEEQTKQEACPATASEGTITKEQAAFLGKWLSILFWLIVPTTIANSLCSQAAAQTAPQLVLPGQLLSLGCAICYAAVLFKMKRCSRHYVLAGICTLISSVIALGNYFVTGHPELIQYATALSLPGLAVALIGLYQECKANAQVIKPVDPAMSRKWGRLWNWMLLSYLGTFGGMLLGILHPTIGAMILLVSSFLTVILGLLELMYLFRTAHLFCQYAKHTEV